MLLSDFDYHLPPESIAQRPLPARDASRMLLLERASGRYEDHSFSELPSLLRGDELFVINDTRVIPARMFGHRLGVRSESAAKSTPAGGQLLSARIEVLLTRRLEADLWEALVRPGRKVRAGERLIFEGGQLEAEVVGRGDFGLRQLRFSGPGDTLAAIEQIGHVPLPPYIRRGDEREDRARYQTVFAARPGAVAAPTAGLHFTPEILQQLRARGAEIQPITLEVGLGTFQPIHSEDLDNHRMHGETYEIPEATVAAIAAARHQGRKILAVGTTVVRALEDSAEKASIAGAAPGTILPGRAAANIFIKPGHGFALVDQLLTNFHLPRSTLLVLVSAFAGREAVLAAYRYAVDAGYRFYSYGDCMLIR
jgi:S-adenosylmethionine:tRNA ribosyltransferase-isomerase